MEHQRTRQLNDLVVAAYSSGIYGLTDFVKRYSGPAEEKAYLECVLVEIKRRNSSGPKSRVFPSMVREILDGLSSKVS